jgi:hypothetical protein
MTIFAFLLLAAVSQECGGGAPDGGPSNFVYFGRDHEPALEPAFLQAHGVDGAQLTFTWRELEPERGQYDFAEIERHLEILGRHGKRLWIQLADVTFTDRLPVPEYLRADTAFHGGAARKYEGSEGVFDGWVARRWDPAVRRRLAALFAALAARFDGRIEGVNLAETAIGFEDPRFHPPGFSFDAYASGIREIMRDAGRAFSRSCVIVYANFMPGESLPVVDHGYLRGTFEAAEELGVGVGGPDLLPYREGQRRNSLPLIASRGEHVVAGMAIQDGNLSEVNPATGNPVTVEHLYRIARDEFRLDYVFWGREEPYYSRDVLPFLASLRAVRR